MNKQRQGYRNVVLKSQSELVYLEHIPGQLPPKPSAGPDGRQWTRFVCISDTHSCAIVVPDGDVLLHSGDLTNTGTVSDFEKTMEWLYGLSHPVKIIIAGNHDLTLHTEWYEHAHERWHRLLGKQDIQPIMQMLEGARAQEAGIVYLQNERYEFRAHVDGKLWSVYGSPWTPEFFNWAFNYEREDAEELISKFPKTDILLTHGPAHQIFDRTITDELVGCEALRARLTELRPRLHLVGHIHEAHGACIHTWHPADGYAPPIVQNDDPMDLTSRLADVGKPTLSEEEDGREGEVELERTVFVNASNWPMGPLANRDGVRSAFGGPGFQAVVVDLKE